MVNAQEIQTAFLNIQDFDRLKDKLNFENISLLQGFQPEETDIIALDFTINSPPVIKNLEIVKGGDFVPFWLERFRKEGVTKEQVRDAFLQLND